MVGAYEKRLSDEKEFQKKTRGPKGIILLRPQGREGGDRHTGEPNITRKGRNPKSAKKKPDLHYI